MKMMSFKDFVADFGKITKHRMNMSMYDDNFQCACGGEHWFQYHGIQIIGDGFYKVMVLCPKSNHVTSVKIKTRLGFGFRGFESLAGAPVVGQEDELLLAATRAAAQLS